jgi:Zn-finger nucleic acid-binding protein
VLRCPKCRELMQEHEVSGHYGAKLKLFQCDSCSGVWVDRDTAFAVSRDSALEVESDIELDDIVTEPREVPLFCPRCEVYLTEETGTNLPEGLRIDYCTTCHGFWFDKGELMIYKTYLEEKRTKSKERFYEHEAKKKERERRLEQIKSDSGVTPGSWHTIGVGYHPGLQLVRQLLRLRWLLR